MSLLIKIFFGVVGLFLLLAVGVSAYAYTQFLPVNSNQKETTRFAVPKGQSAAAIAKRLEAGGLIKNALAFRFEIWRSQAGQKIQEGSFSLSPAMTPAQIVHELTTSPEDVWITTLEGWRREEVAEMLAEQDLPAFDKKKFLELTKDEEGYLFPDTYLIAKLSTTQTIHDFLKSTFDKKVTVGLAKDIQASGRSFNEILTMASLIQREASDPAQMSVVSGILWNRVNAGTALNVDCTLQYIKGYNVPLQTWWAPPTAADKEQNSPFNTYKVAGLPPHPISNPGMDAIKAAINPAKTSYFYYLHDSQGQIHYARTLEEHNQNVQKYLR
jgi:UPF0755 protein